VISVNNSASHLPLASSDCGSASECESGELSSDEYPSQIKYKPISIDYCQENHIDSTQEMGTLAQLLNHSFSAHIDISIGSQKFVYSLNQYLNFFESFLNMQNSAVERQTYER
jgi:hypothetical protein